MVQLTIHLEFSEDPIVCTSLHRVHSPTGAGAVALLLLALGGCDLQRLTGTSAAPGALPRLNEDGTGTLGSSFLSTPASSHPTDVHSTTAQPFAAVPAETWTVIRASGSVQQTWNEDCDDVRGDWVCSTGGVLPPFSETPWTLGPVAFRAEYDDGTGAELPMRRVGENAAVGLFRATRAATLTGKLNLWARWLFRPGQIGIPSYYLTGGFSVSATAIDAPMGLTAGGPDESGGREYSVEPLHGLEFVNPTDLYHLIHPGTILWYFYRGENVSETPAGEANRVPINACAYQRTCYYVPNGSGRVQVSAYVEGRQVVLRSRPVQERIDSLSLQCPVSVERGQPITCTASASGSGVLTEIQWTFTDSAGHEVSGPRDAHEWGGFMVVGGEMRVNALLNGDSTSAAATIGIRARTWPSLRLAVQEENPNHLPPPDAVRASTDLGDAHVDSLLRYPGARIGAGPNEGWWYVDHPLDDIPVYVHINYPAFQAGSAWYNLQRSGVWTNPATGTHHPHCRRSDVPTLLTLTRQHEGSIPSTGATVSHTDAMRDYLATNAPQDFFEALLATDAEVAAFSFDQTVRSFFRAHVAGALRGASRHKPDGQTDAPVFPCMPRYF